jgi:hypothetical protein
MSILPNPSFPLLASDQAEVIEMFFQLMCTKVRFVEEPEGAMNQGFGLSSDSRRLLFPDEPSELG